MPIVVDFKPLPPLNLDESLKWYDHLDDNGKYRFKVFVQKQLAQYLNGVMAKHSSTLPFENNLLCMFAPGRWEYGGKKYSVTIICYCRTAISKQQINLLTRVAVTDWRSPLLQGISKGLKELGNVVRWNQVNAFITPDSTELAELFTKAVEGSWNEPIAIHNPVPISIQSVERGKTSTSKE